MAPPPASALRQVTRADRRNTDEPSRARPNTDEPSQPTPAPDTPDSAQTPRETPAGKGATGSTSPRIPPTNPVKRKAARLNLTPTPTEDELSAFGDVMRLFQQARAHRRPLVAGWYESYRMLYNEFWPGARAGWKPSPSLPEILPVVDALVSWETDQSPRYTVAPRALPHSDYARFFSNLAQNLETVLDASYQLNAEELQWAMANWDKYVFGTGITKTTWDMTLAGGLGDSTTRRVSPFAFYPDPQASCLDDANYFVEVRRMSVQELDRRYPGTAKLFAQGGYDHDVDKQPTQLDSGGNLQPPRANPGAISPVTVPNYGNPGTARYSAVDLPGVTVIECWLREHESYQATDINTREQIPRVYDRWRLVVVAGNRVILDTPADNLWSHGGHPYDRVVLRDVGEFWGRSLVTSLASAQKMVNRLLAAMQQNIELTGNPVFKDVAAQQRTPVTNRPGQRVPVSQQGAQSEWLKPPTLPTDFSSLVQYYLTRMEAISGLTAIARGSTPSGRPSEGVVDSVQESGFVRIRSSLRYLEAAMRSAGLKKASLIAENYTTDRIVAIAGPGGQRTSLALKARHFQLPTSQGAVPLQYQLLVDVGSRQHTSRVMRENQSIQLYTLGAIDEQALLEDVSYPNSDEVAQRVEQKRAQGVANDPGKRERSRA